MNRREFISIVCGAIAVPFVAHAQHGTSVPTVGILWHSGDAADEQPYFDALRQGFEDLGYVQRRNIKLEHRFPNETPDLFRKMASELVALKVNTIVTVGNNTAPYVRDATTSIPLVFLFVSDPIGLKLVDSLARPGRNATGLSNFATDLAAKRFELLRDIVPQLSRVALLFNPAEANAKRYIKEGQEAAAALGLTVLPFELKSPDQMGDVFDHMVHAGVQAVTLGPGGLLFSARDDLQRSALAHRLPTCGWSREMLAAGLLVTYGPDQVAMARHVPVLVDKILRGAKPADLPVELPTRFQLLVNQKTAAALNIGIPAAVLLRADEVIE